MHVQNIAPVITEPDGKFPHQYPVEMEKISYSALLLSANTVASHLLGEIQTIKPRH